MSQATRRSARDRWGRRVLERRLAGDRRAGAWPGGRALRMRYEFMRRAWWLVIAPPIIAGASCPVVLLLPHWTRGFALGAIVASGLWGAAYVVATMSGSSPVLLGQMAEQWTAAELRRLRRRDWRLINAVHFRTWDIDHVLIGPGGTVVAETKFSAGGWEASRYTDRLIADAAGRVRQNAGDLRMRLGANAVPADLVHPVVVLWGRSDLATIDRLEGNVRILSGPLLRQWLSALPDAGLTQDQHVEFYRELVADVERRDRQDLARSGSAPTTVSAVLMLVATTAVVGVLAFVAEVAALRATGWVWAVPVGMAFVALQWPLARFKALRPWRLAWLTGSQVVTVGITGVYIVAGIARIV